MDSYPSYFYVLIIAPSGASPTSPPLGKSKFIFKEGFGYPFILFML